MGISLAKGGKINLSKDFGVGATGLSNLQVGLGWDTNKYDGGNEFDLDTSVFLQNDLGKCRNESDFVFYGNKSGGNGAVIHSGDNRTGDGLGDDEVIEINLSLLPSDVTRISFTVTIHEADLRGQNFGQVSNAYVRIIDKSTGTELVRYDLEEDFSIENAIVVGELYNKGGEWRFGATGAGFGGGLAALVNNFGLSV